MRLCAGDVSLDAKDFNLQRFDASMELLDRHRVEVLLRKLDERVAGFAWEKVFQIHGLNR